MTEESRPKRRDELSQRLVAGERVVLDPKSQAMHQLNITATIVWELCDGENSVVEIARNLAERFEIAEDLALRDVTDTVARFEKEGLLDSD